MFNPLGSNHQMENDLRAQPTSIIRMDKDADYLFRFVKLIGGVDVVFLPCRTKTGTDVIRSFRLAKQDWTFLDELRKIDRALLTENFPDKETRPSSLLSRKPRFYYLVFDRLNDNNLRILEVTKEVDTDLLALTHATSQKTIGALKCGPLFMYDLTIKRTSKKTNRRFPDVTYTLLPEANEYMDKIPKEVLSEDYPTFKMITHYLVENLGEGEDKINTNVEQIKAFMQKYKDKVLKGINAFDYEDEYLDAVVDRYIQSQISKFFTEDEFAQINSFDESTVTFIKPHTNEDILTTLQETPMCLIGTDKFNNPYFRYPHELIAGIQEDYSHLITTEAGTPKALAEGKATHYTIEADVPPPPEVVTPPKEEVKPVASSSVTKKKEALTKPAVAPSRVGWIKESAKKPVANLDAPPDEDNENLPF